MGAERSCQDAFKMSFRAAEDGMTVMCNLRVLTDVIYPSTLQRWDHRHRQTYYEHGRGGYVGLSMGVTLQLNEDDQISTTSYFANVNSCPEEAFVQVQLNTFLRLHHFRCFFSKDNTNKYCYIITLTRARGTLECVDIANTGY